MSEPPPSPLAVIESRPLKWWYSKRPWRPLRGAHSAPRHWRGVRGKAPRRPRLAALEHEHRGAGLRHAAGDDRAAEARADDDGVVALRPASTSHATGRRGSGS